MSDNVTNLFGANGSSEDNSTVEPNFHYTLTLKDGTTHDLVGYIVLNSIFCAICRGEGVIQWLVPMDDIKLVVNNGPAGKQQ